MHFHDRLLTYNVEPDVCYPGGRLLEVDPALVDGLVGGLDVVEDEPAGVVVAAEERPSAQSLVVRPVAGLVSRLPSGVVSGVSEQGQLRRRAFNGKSKNICQKFYC